MAKDLSDILKGANKSSTRIYGAIGTPKIVPGSTGDDPGVDYAGKMKDERDFVALHKTEKFPDRVGNDDDVYNASKVKKAKMERHGHDPDPKAKTAYKLANEAKEEDDTIEFASQPGKKYYRNDDGSYGERETHRIQFPGNDKVYYALGKDPTKSSSSKDNDSEKSSKAPKNTYQTSVYPDDGDKNQDKFKVGGIKASRLNRADADKISQSDFESETNASRNSSLRNRASGAKIARTVRTARAAYKQQNEAKDTREYDYEGEMAISQIKSIMNHSQQLMGMLKPDSNLPEWVQSKITLAKDYIQTAADYYATEMTEDYKCNMSEAGTMCEVHGMKSCSEDKSAGATDKEPRYNGKKKEGRQLITDRKKIEEREMTAADKKREEKLKSKYDDSGMKASMKKQYGDKKGEQVYFAYIRKKAMKSEQADTHMATPSGLVGDTGRV
jgi:hypothetical protein